MPSRPGGVGVPAPCFVPFDEELVAATARAVTGLRRVASEGVMPPPLLSAHTVRW